MCLFNADYFHRINVICFGVWSQLHLLPVCTCVHVCVRVLMCICVCVLKRFDNVQCKTMVGFSCVRISSSLSIESVEMVRYAHGQSHFGDKHETSYDTLFATERVTKHTFSNGFRSKNDTVLIRKPSIYEYGAS